MNTLTQSMENYLRIIYELSYSNKGVRLTDLAERAGVKKASANNAVMKLSKDGYCVQLRYGLIYLTDKGIDYVKSVAGKHIILTKFFTEILQVDEQTAEQEVAAIEYHLSTSTVYTVHQLYLKMKKRQDE